jgi:alkylated DNA repair dioxygenase AlkB
VHAPLANPPTTPLHIDLPDGELLLWQRWIHPEQACACFRLLQQELAWEQSTIRIHGRNVLIPRQNAWYGDPGATYRYSRTTFEPHPWTATLQLIRQQVESTTAVHFNAVLANYYRDGADCVGWHSDDEAELGRNPPIASLSLGSARKFSLKHKRRKDLAPVYLNLEPGSLLLMRGATQHHWQHQIGRTRRLLTPRINLTFRRIVDIRQAATDDVL